MERKLRISGLKDYIAVDVIDSNGKILETVFYLQKDKPLEMRYKDVEERKWVKTELIYDGEFVIATDVDFSSDWHGMKYEIELEELLDSSLTKPIIKL